MKYKREQRQNQRKIREQLASATAQAQNKPTEDSVQEHSVMTTNSIKMNNRFMGTTPLDCSYICCPILHGTTVEEMCNVVNILSACSPLIAPQ